MVDLEKTCLTMAAGKKPAAVNAAWSSLLARGEAADSASRTTLWDICNQAVKLADIAGLVNSFELLDEPSVIESICFATGQQDDLARQQVKRQLEMVRRMVASAVVATLVRERTRLPELDQWVARSIGVQAPAQDANGRSSNALDGNEEMLRAAYGRFSPTEEVAEGYDAARSLLQGKRHQHLAHRIPILTWKKQGAGTDKKSDGQLAWLYLQRRESPSAQFYRPLWEQSFELDPTCRQAFQSAWHYAQQRTTEKADARWWINYDNSEVPQAMSGASCQAAATVALQLLLDGKCYSPSCVISAEVSDDGQLERVGGINDPGHPKLHAALKLKSRRKPVTVVVSDENALSKEEQANWLKKGVDVRACRHIDAVPKVIRDLVQPLGARRRKQLWRGVTAATAACLLAGVLGLVILTNRGNQQLANVNQTLDEVKDDTTSIRKDTGEIVDSSARTAEATEQLRDNLQGIGQLGGIINNPESPAQFYHNARIYELRGDFRSALQSYRKYLDFNQEFIDPYESFLSFLKQQQGYKATAEEFRRLQERFAENRALAFAAAGLYSGAERVAYLRRYLQKNPDVAPAYLALANAFSVQARPSRSSMDATQEQKYLLQFAAAVERGEFYQFYLDKKLAKTLCDDTLARIISQSNQGILASFQGKVFFQPLGTSITVIDQNVRNISYSFDENNWLTGEQFRIAPAGNALADVNQQQLLKRKTTGGTLFVKYTDGRGQESRVFAFPFKPVKQGQMFAGKVHLEIDGEPAVPKIMRDTKSTINEVQSRLSKEIDLPKQATDQDIEDRIQLSIMARKVDLSGRKISDRALGSIGSHPLLSNANLADTPVTDEGLSYLKNARLRTLNLRGTKVTSKGMRHLTDDYGLGRYLRELDLSNTAIDDSAVAELTKLSALKKINLQGTKITADGVAQLKAAVPECDIKHD